MAAIVHTFTIRADTVTVFKSIAMPAGLDRWWTLTSAGQPLLGTCFDLDFGPDYQWRAQVKDVEVPYRFTLELTKASNDWMGTSVSFGLEELQGGTRVRFRHVGWREVTDHYATTSFCWAMYLRILRRFLENGEFVPYERRLEV